MPGVQGALLTYTSHLPNLQFSGPTHYSDIINFINQKDLDHNMFYKVCVIITDGEPQDLQETIDNLVITSFKPISFVVVTVSLKIMDQLDH